MRVSVITINLNNYAGLKRTIDSVLTQTCQDYEWIVIDGGSTDGSVELLESCKEHFSHCISEPDGGVYEAMNKGIGLARGEYLSFMNSGDVYACDTVLEYFDSHCDGSDFIVGRSVYAGDGQPLAKEPPYTLEDEVFRLCISAYPHQATFIRRDVFQKYGLYREDKKLASDWYLTVEALFKGRATVSHLPVLVSVCEGDGISSRMRKELYRERESLIKENPYFAVLFNYYTENLEMVKALKGNKAVFFLFRLYYYLHRKFNAVFNHNTGS